MTETSFTLSDFDFNLPEEYIAQYPSEKREDSRLFVIDRFQKFHHKKFTDIIEFLRDGDVLVLNTARVIPARIRFRRASSGKVEVVLTQRLNARCWLAITNKSSRLKAGETLYAENDSGIAITIEARVGDSFRVKSSEELTDELLEKIGSTPLPPYIKRDATSADRIRYQTVYAEKSGAVAAPTAGLHFTEGLLAACAEKGVWIAKLNLDVSWGTFSPVRDEDLSKHRMHSERYFLPEDAASLVNGARNQGRRIIAVGTTSLRVLESTFINGENIPGEGSTDIFIYPPKKVCSADCLITNFHTPRSTLLMLVCAFGGYDLVMNAYREAVKERYRFFSYGDAMLVERK